MKKVLMIIGIVVLVLIALVSIVVGFYLGPIVTMGINDVGPKVTQVTTRVDGVDISLMTGSAKIKGFVLGNPSGYTTPDAINVGTITVSLDPMSVTSKKILIHSVNVESPVITFEGGISSNNLTKIMNNVNSFAKGPANNTSTGNAGNAPKSNNPSAAPAPKIEVDDFAITGAKVQVKLPALGVKTVPLPDIHLTDLGKGTDGLTPAELTSAVLGALISDTVKTVAGTLTNLSGGITQGLGGDVNKISGAIGGLFHQ